MPSNRAELAGILARPEHVGGSAEMIVEILAGDLPVGPDGSRRRIPGYLTFHVGAANFPWQSQALWTYSQMARWGQVGLGEEEAERAASAFRPDLYRAVFADRIATIPTKDRRIETGPTGTEAMPGHRFDPEAIAGYVAEFPIRQTVDPVGHGNHGD